MDNLMDKLLQKYYSQEMIRANTEGEQAEKDAMQKQIDVLQKQVEQYDDLLKEMRKLNFANMESAQEVQNLVKAFGDEIGTVSAESGKELIKISGEAARKLDETGKKLDDGVKKLDESAKKLNEGVSKVTASSEVKLSRTCEESSEKMNLLANTCMEKMNRLSEEASAKIAELQIQPAGEAGEKIEELKQMAEEAKAQMQELFQQLEEHVHKENVKVYRNVQAVVVDEISKQTTELIQEREKDKGKSTTLMVLGVIVLVISLADFGIMLARILGLI